MGCNAQSHDNRCIIAARAGGTYRKVYAVVLHVHDETVGESVASFP